MPIPSSPTSLGCLPVSSNASQEAVCTLYKCLVASLRTPEQLDLFVESGGPGALEALAAREELEGRTPMRNAVRKDSRPLACCGL